MKSAFLLGLYIIIQYNVRITFQKTISLLFVFSIELFK